MKKIVNVLVGLPGVGKSHYASLLSSVYGHRVLSSDDIRLQMYGSLAKGNGKEQNTKVFQKMHSDLEELVKDDETKRIIYDATNLNRNRRRDLYNNIKGWNKEAEVNIIYIMAPLQSILRTNVSRKVKEPEKAVPTHVLEQMYINMQVPRLEVDCDRFEVRGERFFSSIRLEDVVEHCEAEDVLDHFVWHNLEDSDTIAFHNEILSMYQKHDCAPWHLEDINEHISMCVQEAIDRSDEILTRVALFHDLGKGVTKKMVEKNGKTMATYRGHANVSANYFLNYVALSGTCMIKDEDYVAMEVIHSHMNHHQGMGEKNIRKNKLDERVLAYLDTFGIIDSESRIKGGII